MIKDISVLSGIPNKIGTYTSSQPVKKISYYKKYEGKSVSIVDALASLGYNSNFAYRTKIAKANGIKTYLGTSKQNTNLLNLLKSGKLKKF